MIDDDFNEMIRKMMEQFFGMALNTQDNNVFGVQSPAKRLDLDETPFDTEEIELEDRVLIIMSNIQDDVAPIVKVKGRRIVIQLFSDSIVRNMPFDIDRNHSFMTISNGICEINLIKSEEQSSREWMLEVKE